MQFVTQTEWPFPSTKFQGIIKGKLIFTEIKRWEGGSLIYWDNREFPDPNQKFTDQNKNTTKSQPNNPKFDKLTKKIQQKKAFNIQNRKEAKILPGCHAQEWQRVEWWVYHWEQRWQLDRWEKREKRKTHVSVERNICVPVIFLSREKEDTCFFLLIKSKKHFPLRVDFPLINCKIFPLTFNYFLSYLKPKNVKCFPFHQKKWSISMYKLPQKWNMKSKIRKPYLYLILSLQAKDSLQDGQVQIFPL